MDEELWLDYYYRNKEKEDPEPDQDNDLEPEIDQEKEAEPEQPREEIKYQEKDELENIVQAEIAPRRDQNQEKQNQHQEHHERKRWGREHDRRSRIAGRTYQRSQQTIIYKAPSLQREIKKEIPRPLSATDQIINLAMEAIKKLENPNQKKRSIYFGKVYELKDQNKLAPSTAAKYERETRTMKELMQQRSNEEMFLHIVHLATNKSRSTYFRQKAILERILSDQEAAGDRSGIGLLRMLRHMPDYHRIRHIFGQEVERSKETDKRRTCKIGLDAVIEYGNEIASRNRQMKYVPMIMYITGARISELQAMRIYAEPDNSLTVRIRSAKTGCAKNAPKERVLKIAPSDITKGLIRMGIGTKYREPYANIPTQTIRNNLLAARRRLSRRGIDVPSPHYFRHNYATQQREAGVSNEDLRRKLGHTSQETTRQYGGGNIRQSH